MSFSGIYLVQFIVFSVYWVAAAFLLYGQFKLNTTTTTTNIQWISFSTASMYLIVFFLITLLHHKFMKDERNTGWYYGDDGKHTNHSTAAVVNETLNEIQLQAPTTTAKTTTLTVTSNKNIGSASVRECEKKKFYQKVGQQELWSKQTINIVLFHKFYTFFYRNNLFYHVFEINQLTFN